MARKVARAVREMRDYLAGERDGVRVTTYEFPDVKAIRESLGLTQVAFAKRFHIPVTTVRDWEQRRRNPDQAACAFLRVIAKTPRTVAKALAAE